MNNCNICGNKLQLLFSSWFCPKDCDRPKNFVEDDKDIWYCVSSFVYDNPKLIEGDSYMCTKDLNKALDYVKSFKVIKCFGITKIKAIQVSDERYSVGGSNDYHAVSGEVLEKIQIDRP
jgi:hypothetical protein